MTMLYNYLCRCVCVCVCIKCVCVFVPESLFFIILLLFITHSLVCLYHWLQSCLLVCAALEPLPAHDSRTMGWLQFLSFFFFLNMPSSHTRMCNIVSFVYTGSGQMQTQYISCRSLFGSCVNIDCTDLLGWGGGAPFSRRLRKLICDKRINVMRTCGDGVGRKVKRKCLKMMHKVRPKQINPYLSASVSREEWERKWNLAA